MRRRDYLSSFLAEPANSWHNFTVFVAAIANARFNRLMFSEQCFLALRKRVRHFCGVKCLLIDCLIESHGRAKMWPNIIAHKKIKLRCSPLRIFCCQNCCKSEMRGIPEIRTGLSSSPLALDLKYHAQCRVWGFKVRKPPLPYWRCTSHH